MHSGAGTLDETLYSRLYKRKEKAFVQLEREVYNVDLRFMLEQDGAELVPVGKLFNGEEIPKEDILVYEMPPEERLRIEKRIMEYDARPPFDEAGCKQHFKNIQEWNLSSDMERLPEELRSQIADPRVFTLGYCTRDILNKLKTLSKDNERQRNRVLEEYHQAQQEEKIPEHIRDRFHFHDCRVTELYRTQNMVIRLDPRGGFTSLNKITFVAPEVLKQDEGIAGRCWLYDELYCVDGGYEVHVLFEGNGMPELIIRCKDIVLEER
ncbi:DUF4085 family protein [Paenibacillus sp. PK3_47]|uniref:DUF4085 family protein n=1 Tax=Paenibacillus sp. PK3_47 TaxID=2072642 RepID=UPI00201E5775|nr:DUF4085 family protein [Paenibacillus sp. PK3_47]